MPTFVHTADVHLDTPFSTHFNPKQMQLRRREVMKTFQKITEVAKEKDFLFISGDLFDGRFVSSETVAFVKRCFEELGETKVFLVAGNHDPLTPGSVYRMTDWGENVYIFGTEWEYFDFPELKTRVHGRSFSKDREEATLLTELSAHPDWCNIMVVHGEVVADGGESVYNPIYKGFIEKSGMDYIALGHIHQASDLLRLGNTRFAYPGVPEGRGFDEEGEKGFYVGTLEKNDVQLSWHPSARRKFWHLPVDVTGMEDGLKIQSAIKEAINDAGGMDDIYKIQLTGKASDGISQTDILKEELKDAAFYLDVLDETRPQISIEELARENTLRGEFVATMLEQIEAMPEEEKDLGYLALDLGIKAMEGGQGL